MFRFTIREVLWLTVVVALGVGWWVDHSRLVTMWNNQRGRIFWLKLELEGRGEIMEPQAKEWRMIQQRYNLPSPSVRTTSD